MAKFAAGVADTGGKFAAGVVDTGGNFARETGGKKIRNDPNVIIRSLGKVIHEKNLKQKISWHCPFNLQADYFL